MRRLLKDSALVLSYETFHGEGILQIFILQFKRYIL